MPSLASKKVKAFIRFEYETEMIIDMPAEESVSCVKDHINVPLPETFDKLEWIDTVVYRAEGVDTNETWEA